MVVLPTLASILILGLVTARYENELFRLAVFVALAGHIIVSVVVLPRLPYTWDITQFHKGAQDVAMGVDFVGSSTIGTFAGFQGLLYTIFAPQPETLGIINGLLAILIVIPATYLADCLYSVTDSKESVVIIGVLFLPLHFLFLSIPMRDTLSALIFFTLLALCIEVRKQYTIGLITIPLWGLLYLLRAELALVLLLGVLTVIFVSVVRYVGIEISIPRFAMILGLIGSIGLGLFAELLLSFERVNAQLRGRVDGGAVYLDGMEYQSWFDFLLAAPSRGIYFQFAPFPLHVESVFHLLAFFNSVLLILLFVSAVRSLYYCEYDETVMVFLIVIYTAGVIGYGTINSNFGTNVRHRVVFDFLLIISASPVLQQWWLRLHAWVSIGPSQNSNKSK